MWDILFAIGTHYNSKWINNLFLILIFNFQFWFYGFCCFKFVFLRFVTVRWSMYSHGTNEWMYSQLEQMNECIVKLAPKTNRCIGTWNNVSQDWYEAGSFNVQLMYILGFLWLAHLFTCRIRIEQPLSDLRILYQDMSKHKNNAK